MLRFLSTQAAPNHSLSHPTLSKWKAHLGTWTCHLGPHLININARDTFLYLFLTSSSKWNLPLPLLSATNRTCIQFYLVPLAHSTQLGLTHRHTSFCCASLYWALQILHFSHLKDYGDPALSKSISAIFPTTCAHFVCLYVTFQ